MKDTPRTLTSRRLIDAAIVVGCITPSLLVGIMGLGRVYDAIPDQDMLWASEALRLLRGVAPSYADHPGAFWAIVYQFNIQAIQAIFNQPAIDGDGNILPSAILSVIKIARIQNALLAGLCGPILYSLLLQLDAGKRLAAAAAIITSLSSAVLVGVSEIRHEVISSLLLLAFSTWMSRSYAKGLSKKSRYALSLFGIICFFGAALSKQQVLLCSPLAFAAVLTSLRLQQNQYFSQKLESLCKISQHSSVALFVAAVIPWAIAAHPDIDLINMPFWIALNIGLAACISPIAEREDNGMPLVKSLAVIGLTEIIILKVITPGWWRQGVTGFPSWMFRYADNTTDRSFHTIEGLIQYFQQLFLPWPIALASFALVLGISTIMMARVLRGSRQHQSLPETLHELSLPISWLTTALIAVACSQRVASRYEIYFFMPIIALSSITAKSATCLTNHPHAIRLCLAGCSVLLLCTAALHSAANAFQLGEFVNQGQPSAFRCFGHHMDQSMRLTSAGDCPNFAEAALNKNAYDNWSGPR